MNMSDLNKKSEITFGVKNGWIMTLSQEGIKFNTEKYPPDKISEEVIRILCESFWPKIKQYYEKRMIVKND